MPWAMTMPNSPNKPRIWLTSAVRSAHRQFAGAMHRQYCLLLDGFHRHKAHLGSPDRLTNSLRIIAVVLAAFSVGRDELPRDQTHRVAEFRELARPVVGTGAGFDPN